MRFLEVLCEGSSDVPAIREVLTRRLCLTEGTHFRIHPHRGKGKLPARASWLKRPSPGDDTLLTQLPIKLKNIGRQTQQGFEVAVVVIVDADDDNCRDLKRALVDLYDALPTKPPAVLFRIAVEETESWFIADLKAVRKAFSGASVRQLASFEPDSVCGAWERLAEAIGYRVSECRGGEKIAWATAISPHLDLDQPKSPSLLSLITGLEQIIQLD